MAETLDAFTLGATPGTLPDATTNTLLRDADPCLFFLLDFLSWGLARAFQTRLLAEVAKLPSSGRSPITQAVAYVTHRDPTPLITSNQVRYPLLAIYRKTSDHTERTMGRNGQASKLDVLYVLPPMTASNAEALSPILNVANAVVVAYAKALQHPLYTPPGGTLGEDLHAKTGIDFCVADTSRWGSAPFSEGLYMPALAMELDLREVEGLDLDALPALEGIDGDTGIHDPATDTDVGDVADITIPTL